MDLKNKLPKTPSTVEDTTKRDSLEHLRSGVVMGGSNYIEDMEKRGQEQLVKSQQIPTKLSGCTEAQLTDLGFELGEVCAADPMFRMAKLPKGWKRKGGDHAMWSYLIDENGLERASIFYKAAFYDRSAHLVLSTRIRCERDYKALDAHGMLRTHITATMPSGQEPKILHTITDDVKWKSQKEQSELRVNGKDQEYFNRYYAAQDAHDKLASDWVKANHPDPKKHWDPAL